MVHFKKWKIDKNKNIDEIELDNDGGLELNNLLDLELVEKEKDTDFENFEDIGKNKKSMEYILNMIAKEQTEKTFFKFIDNKCDISHNSITPDGVLGAYLRIEIPNNIEPKKILQKYANVELELNLSNTSIYKAPLKIFYYLCEKFGRDIEIIYPKKLSKKKKKPKINETNSEVNQRYYYENKNVRYLDIPIVFDDFNNSQIYNLIANKEQKNYYYLNGDVRIEENCYIVYERLIYYETYKRRKILYSSMTEHLTNSIYYKPIESNQNLNINIGGCYVKFLFLFMEKNPYSIIDFPEILSFTTIHNNNTTNYDIYNFLLEDYEHCRFYGMSFDPNISMKKWTDLKKDQYKDDDILNKKTKFKVARIDNINIELSPYVGKINMSILLVHQNILNNICGMSGLAYFFDYKKN